MSNLPPAPSSELLRHLHSLLVALQHNPYPHVPNPLNCKKRASTALIIRVHPSYNAWPEPFPPPADQSAPELPRAVDSRLQEFFDQPWVKHGEPEVLFIKRAARLGDRWNSHVALPGGKRDPEDETDCDVAIRETWEEVGIDLRRKDVLYVGNLSERVVTTEWGTVPLMVLWTFVFLITAPDLPPLRLQPTEVGSTHWVPLRVLLSPGLRTYEYADVSDRLARRWGKGVKRLLQLLLGQMTFAAVRLVPTESLYSTTGSESFPLAFSSDADSQRGERSTRSIKQSMVVPRSATSTTTTDRPLLLWGLTLGVIADFLDLLPAHDALRFWTYPTFTSPDLRFVLWLLSYRFRSRKERELRANDVEGVAVVEEGMDAVTAGGNWQPDADQQRQSVEVGIGGLGVGKRSQRPSRASVVGKMLEGYLILIRRAVMLTMALRLTIGSGALLAFWLRRRNRPLRNL